MHLEDKDILSIYKINKKEGLDVIVHKYKDPLYKFSLHLCKSRQEAEDLFQDTWIKVFRNLEKYDENKNLKTWIFTICINSYKDKYRKNKRWLNIIKDYFNNDEKEKEVINIGSEENLPEEEMVKNFEKAMLKEAVESLKEEYKLPVILYYFQELSYKDISEVLSIPEGTIKSRLNKARKLIKEYMEGKVYG
ncbi:RNA polymerase sigma factor [Clostridium malenominatum]|uniref:RNA polymerase sigma factor n=1 Tax=Clostridium malenominatum TaxID=1539 RepID=A0ABN1J191_9CLOT